MDLSLGRARPMLAAIRRCGSFVEFSLITVKATWPGLMCFRPSLREINLQLGGKIEETRTILHAAMPALRRASSKLESRSRCLPTPLVRKIRFATNAMDGAGLRCLLLCACAAEKREPGEINKKPVCCQSLSRFLRAKVRKSSPALAANQRAAGFGGAAATRGSARNLRSAPFR